MIERQTPETQGGLEVSTTPEQAANALFSTVRTPDACRKEYGDLWNIAMCTKFARYSEDAKEKMRAIMDWVLFAPSLEAPPPQEFVNELRFVDGQPRSELAQLFVEIYRGKVGLPHRSYVEKFNRASYGDGVRALVESLPVMQELRALADEPANTVRQLQELSENAKLFRVAAHNEGLRRQYGYDITTNPQAVREQRDFLFRLDMQEEVRPVQQAERRSEQEKIFQGKQYLRDYWNQITKEWDTDERHLIPDILADACKPWMSVACEVP